MAPGGDGLCRGGMTQPYTSANGFPVGVNYALQPIWAGDLFLQSKQESVRLPDNSQELRACTLGEFGCYYMRAMDQFASPTTAVHVLLDELREIWFYSTVYTFPWYNSV